MERKIHIFDNGVKVYDDHLLPLQRTRYRLRNVHEAEEEDIFVRIIQAIPDDACYVNIGSAIGYYPLLAKRLAPRLHIHAIEPLERHRKFFIENLALNGLGQSDVDLHAEGISSINGKARFLDRGYGSSIQWIRGTKKQIVKGVIKRFLVFIGLREEKDTIVITTKTLDKILTEIGRPVSLCQMDVQGLEMEVLKGGRHALRTAGSIETFLIGTHSRQLHQDCRDFLVRNGYAVEYDNFDTKDQPDGILVASKGIRRLTVSESSA